ncbi:hypothetical protein B0A68_17010 [Flavobacterium reichenbachii]|nr:hypothetical protein B0A68_17010 [Flavobacterium reichenbachii]
MKTNPKDIDNTFQINRIINTADLFFDHNKKDSAYYYFNKVQSICDPKQNPDEYVYSLTCMAEILQLEGDYITSEYILTKTMPHLSNTTRPRYRWYVYTIMAHNYSSTYDHKNAIIFHKKAMKYALSLLKKRATLSNIGAVYADEGKYKEAIKILLPLAEKNELYKKYPKNIEMDYAKVLDNLGNCYFKLNNPKALYYYNESLKIKLELKDEEGIMFSHKNLSNYYIKSNPKLAENYAKSAYNKSFKIKAISSRLKCLGLLIKCTEGSDLRKYSLKYTELADSINSSRLRKKNQFALIKYNSKKNKDENLQLKTQKAENELQLERQKNRNTLSYIIIIFIVGFLFFLFFYLATKGKREKNETINKSEVRISNKLHNELAMDVYETLNFAGIQDLESKENKEFLVSNLEKIYKRVRNISKENSIIITDENYYATLKEMISDFKTPNLNILVNGMDSIPWNQIDKNKKIIVYRILQELCLNMKKHSDASLVSFIFKIIDQNVIINYTDNGVGIKNGRIILKNGLQNVESRTKTINGTINFDTNSDKGFKLSFTFPL